jgi:hypothetical protein
LSAFKEVFRTIREMPVQRTIRPSALVSALALTLLGAPALAEPTGGPAEYAFRWSPQPDHGPASVDEAAQLLALSKGDLNVYVVQYAEARRPAGLPDKVNLIVRQRSGKSGSDAGKVESSYKLRAAEPLVALAPEQTFRCGLKSATWENEVDVGWSLPEGSAASGFDADKAALLTTPTYSRTCSSKGSLTKTMPPAELHAEPLDSKCAAEMARYKDDGKKLKLERWRMPGGEVVLEVSRKVKKDNSDARLEFETTVVRPLLRAGAVPSRESKTELAKCN